jgi:D-alanyl-D-alanine carboxypeptidase (penicillin-binding protein 5/6)
MKLLHALRNVSVLAVLAAFTATSLIAPVQAQQQQQRNRPAAKPQPAKPANPQAQKKEPVEPMTPSQIGIETFAKQAYLVDVTTGTVLLAKDADQQMLPSSMAKMMTIYLLWEEMKAGRVRLDSEFRASERAWRLQGSKMFVAIDSMVAVKDLIPGIIVHSGNDATVVVAEGISGSEDAFAERMTKRGREIGMTNTVFKNASGWPADGQFTTAHDMAILAKRTIEDFPDYYKRYYAEGSFKYQNYDTQYNRNPLLGRVSGADGLKTGHTEEAGYGLTASVQRGERRIVLVVNGLSSMRQRQQETERLVEWAFREFNNLTAFKAGETVGSAQVWMGQQNAVPLTVEKNVVMTLPRTAKATMKASIVYDGPVKAPIAKGQRIGKVLVVPAENAGTIEVPLVAAANVEKLGFMGRVVAAMKYYLLGSAV